MCFGGLPTGRIYEFAGSEGSGKTTTAMDIIKNAQKNIKVLERKYYLWMKKILLIMYGQI